MRLPNDICRCMGQDCDRKENCARHETELTGEWRSFMARVCSKDYDSFIAVEIKGDKK